MAFSLKKRSSTHTVMTGAVAGYQTLIILKVCLQTADRPLLALLHLYRGLITYISFSYLSSYSFIFVFCLSLPFSPWYLTSAHLLHWKTFFQFSLFFPSRQVMGRCSFRSPWHLLFPLETDRSCFKNGENERLSFFFVTASFVLISVRLSHTPSAPKWTYMWFFQKWTLNLFTPLDCECS